MAATEAAFGVWLVYLSWGPLQNLFGGYMDSAPIVYLLFGGFFFIPGVTLIWLAVRDVLPSPAAPAGGGTANAGHDHHEGSNGDTRDDE